MHTTAPRATRLGEGAMLVAATAYGVSTTVSVAALDRIRPADLVAVELIGAAVALVAVGLVRRTLTREGWLRNAAIGALMPGLAFVLGDLGLSRTSATAGSLLLAADLPLSVLLAVVFLRERLRGWGAAALGLGLAGSAIVALGGGGGDGGRSPASTVGNLLVVASVLAAAVFLVLTRLFNGADGFTASTWQTLGAAVCTLPFVLVGWRRGGSELTSAGPRGWAYALGVLACTAIASVAFNWGISRVPGVRASQLLNLTPVVGLVAAVVFLAERPSVAQYLGGGLVLVAVVLLVRVVDREDGAGLVVVAEPGDDSALVAERPEPDRAA